MNLEDRVRTRIAELNKGLEEYIREANMNVARYNAAIEELELLLRPAEISPVQASTLPVQDPIFETVQGV